MKCQIVFCGKNKKTACIAKCHLLKILPRVLIVNRALTQIEVNVLHFWCTVFSVCVCMCVCVCVCV